MKTILRSITLLLLTLSVLLGSVGVALSKQLCRMVEMEAENATNKSGSCCQKSSDSEEDADCCTAKISYEKLEPVSSIKTFSLEVPVFFPVQFKPFVAHQVLYFAKDKRILTYSDSSPPLYGRSLLHQIHILVV